MWLGLIIGGFDSVAVAWPYPLAVAPFWIQLAPLLCLPPSQPFLDATCLAAREKKGASERSERVGVSPVKNIHPLVLFARDLRTD